MAEHKRRLGRRQGLAVFAASVIGMACACALLGYSFGATAAVSKAGKRSSNRLLRQVGEVQVPTEGLCFDITASSWKEEHGATKTGRRAVATLIFTASHAQGALALYSSFMHVGPPPDTDFVVMCTDSLPAPDRQRLQEAGITVLVVEPTETPPGIVWGHPACQGKPTCELFTKLRVWQLTQYDKVLFLDADMIVIKALDEVFTWCADMPVMGSDLPPDEFPPVGMPQTGAILLSPSNQTFEWLLREVALDRGPLPELLANLPTQSTMGFAFAENWHVAGAVNLLCTDPSTTPCDHRLRGQPESVRNFWPPLQTIKRGLEYKSKDEAVALLKETGTFLLHFVATKPWDDNAQENKKYAGVHELWWDMLQLQATANPAPCVHYEMLIAATLASASPPQLTGDQLHWIADEIYASGQGKGAATNFLVFGLGLDSILWNQINCGGRTVFLENFEEWMQKILGIDPGLEAYKVEYNTTVAGAETFFAEGPWSLPVPESVADTCFDVILVDAPQGYRPDLPGRMQSCQLAIDLAARCVASGQRQKVTIFLHDVHRPLEQQLVSRMFLGNPRMYYLGRMNGVTPDNQGGDLVAFEYSNNVRPQSAQW